MRASDGKAMSGSVPVKLAARRWRLRGGLEELPDALPCLPGLLLALAALAFEPLKGGEEAGRLGLAK
jgi:hypothetical protein